MGLVAVNPLAHAESESETSLSRLKKIDLIRGIEFIRVGPGQAIESQWGHAALRLLIDPNKPAEDLIISFVADTGFFVDYMKALNGNYAFTISAMPLKEFISQNAVREKRNIYSTVIPTDQISREHLRQILLNFDQSEFKKARYFFTDNNCIAMLFKVLVKAEIILPIHPNKKTTAMPANGPDFLLLNLATPFYETFLVDADTLWSIANKITDELRLEPASLTNNLAKLNDQSFNLVYFFNDNNFVSENLKVHLFIAMNKRHLKPSMAVFFEKDLPVEYHDVHWLETISAQPGGHANLEALDENEIDYQCRKIANFPILNKLIKDSKNQILPKAANTNKNILSRLCAIY